MGCSYKVFEVFVQTGLYNGFLRADLAFGFFQRGLESCKDDWVWMLRVFIGIIG